LCRTDLTRKLNADEAGEAQKKIGIQVVKTGSTCCWQSQQPLQKLQQLQGVATLLENVYEKFSLKFIVDENY
jgi:hypothetical protein